MIRAIVGDTWQQSRQQGVFIVMLVIMALVLVVGVALPRTLADANGNKAFGTILSDEPMTVFEQQWINAYAETLGMGADDGPAVSFRDGDGGDRAARREEIINQLREQQQRRAAAVAEASNIPPFQRAVEYYISVVVGAMFTITLLLFIAACAGYFPAMLTNGAVDIVLAKPISRLKIYSGKYLGGIALYGAAILAFNTLLYLGIGLRTGVWHERIFLSIPLLVFTAMVLYALLALVGTLSKSATLALVLGYVFYLVVDSLVGVLLDFQPVFMEMGWETVGNFTAALRYLLPNFGIMKDMAVASVLNVPVFESTPFVVALAWLAGSFALGYWIFQRRDY